MTTLTAGTSDQLRLTQSVLSDIGFSTWLAIGARNPRIQGVSTFSFTLGGEDDDVCQASMTRSQMGIYSVEVRAVPANGHSRVPALTLATIHEVRSCELSETLLEITEDFGLVTR